MKIGPGETVRIRNLVTNQETNFEIREFFEYRGQHVCYAMRIFSEVHMAAAGGWKGLAEGQASWVLLAAERPTRELKFTEYLGGLPLAIVDEFQGTAPLVETGTGPDGIPQFGPAARTEYKFIIASDASARTPAGQPRAHGTWTGPLKTKDDHIQKCLNIIDRYFEIHDSGELNGRPKYAHILGQLGIRAGV